MLAGLHRWGLPKEHPSQNLAVAVDEAPTAFEPLLIKVHQVEEAI